MAKQSEGHRLIGRSLGAETCLILLKHLPAIASGNAFEAGLQVNTRRASDKTLLTC
jgi:hypothetical protein